jgi:D-alanyl-D-alanine carboxypeptidase
VQTRYGAYADWHKSLLDTALRLPSGYAPPDLVDTATAGLNAGFSIRAVAADDLRAMASDAEAAGAGLAVNSAYRSYAQQKRDFHAFVQQVGWKQAVKYGARPGHSEHQLGVTIDFRSASSARAPWNYPNWGKTRPGSWMRANAWRYGFVMSYPSAKRSLTCMSFEPWHYRYVGREAASAIRTQHLTTREYLWQTWETAP